MPPLPSVSDALFLALLPRRLRRAWRCWSSATSASSTPACGSTRSSARSPSARSRAALLYDAVSVTIAGDTLGHRSRRSPIRSATCCCWRSSSALLALTGWRPGRDVGAHRRSRSRSAPAATRSTSTARRSGTYDEGTILDSVWPASVLLLADRRVAAAALQRRAPRGRADHGHARAVRAASAIALFVVDQVEPLNPLALGLACGTIVALVLRMAVTLRENLQDGRRQPRRGADRRADRPRQPPQARRRPRAGARRRQPRRAAHPHPLRPRRLQALQRQLRPPRRRRAARAPRREARAPRSSPYGEAYRLGGDEFCAVVDAPSPTSSSASSTPPPTALRDSGEGFAVESSYGAVAVPQEADSPALALQIADQRMYARKEGRSSPVREQTRDVLVRALHARQPELSAHASGVAAMARRRRPAPRRRGRGARRGRPRRRAARRRQGRRARRDPRQARGARPTTSGRSCAATRSSASGSSTAPRRCARSRGSSARRTSASTARGYPDGLAGEAIPLGARIVARLRRVRRDDLRPPVPPAPSAASARSASCAAPPARQFDPRVVEAFVAELEERGARGADRCRPPTTARAYVREVAGRLRTALDQESSAA